MKLLAAINDDALLEALAAQPGVEVLPVASLDGGLAALGDEVSAAIVEEALPFAYPLITAVRTQYDGPDRDRLPVVLLANGNGAQDRALVRCLPDVSVAQADPARLLDSAKSVLHRRARQLKLFDQELRLQVPTAAGCVEQAAETFERLIERLGYDDEEQTKITHTFREAIGNAAEHGNKNDPAKTIHVYFLRQPDRITVVIRDEGPGHDTNAFLNRTGQVSALEHTRSRRENEARPGGLGVFIMKQTCDRIAFNDKGNKILLMKFLPGRARG